jgi:hypothetical protein
VRKARTGSSEPGKEALTTGSKNLFLGRLTSTYHGDASLGSGNFEKFVTLLATKHGTHKK